MARAAVDFRGRNPDVLSCIANLSNDEVFTPPDFANRMLDDLAEAWTASRGGEDLWSRSDVTFLDPCTKSGVFLREIVRRLVDGLADELPDLQTRVDHILTKQVFGVATTELTALLARRTLYCSKFASREHSVATLFKTDDGNIWFEEMQHSWSRGACVYCGASQQALDRGEQLETHAYAFIHTNDIKTRMAELFGGDMQFDVIVGNPPYQLADGGFGTSASPIYHEFVQRALDLDPAFAVFVTPSRWFAGGKGLDDFRARMLGDRRIRKLVDYPKLYEAFPNVKLRGGVSYFVWQRDYSGPCSVQTMWDGQQLGSAVSRYLDAYDVLVRRNEAVPILEKVRARKEPTLDSRVSSRKPFGLPTNYRGKSAKTGMAEPVQLFGAQRVEWIERRNVPLNEVWVDDWKVLMTNVQGTSAAVETKFLSKPIIAGPGTACTETYLVAGRFVTEREAMNYATYLRSRFVRFLVSLRKPTHHATRGVYAFVPDLPLDREWTDAELYKRYGLTADEVAFIESEVAEHDDAASNGATDYEDADE